MKFRFLQLSDLHIGDRSSFCKRLQRYTEEVLKKGINIINEYKLDALFIAGDFFENNSIEDEEIKFIFECLKGLQEIPVFISPGNHEFYKGSLYDPNVLRLRDLGEWPTNVKIFSKNNFEAFSLSDAVIYGRANTNREDRAFDHLPELNSEKVNIAIFHGSRERNAPKDKESWLPFTDEELISSGFDYVALGHYHDYAEIRDKDGNIRGAYSGSPLARAKDETGNRGGLIIEVIKEGDKTRVDTEYVILTDFQVKKESIYIEPNQDISSLKNMMIRRMKEVRSLKDTYFIFEFEGMLEKIEIEDLEKLVEELRKHCFDIEFKTINLHRNSLLKDFQSQKTTEGLFIQKMKELIDRAQSDEERKRYERARLYGLDAFKGKEIRPRYED